MTRLVLIVCLLAPLAASAAANGAEERLKEAVSQYLHGDHERARASLTEILIDESVEDTRIRLKARIFLGEVLFVQGRREAAWDAFRAIIEDEPRHRLDPYEHPPDVVDFYETVRAAVGSLGPARTPPPPAPTEPRLPPAWLSFMPLGSYQFSAGRPGMGGAIAIGQATFAVLSTALWLDLKSDNHTGDPDEYEAMIVRRNVNYGAFALTWGFYSAGVVDALIHKSRHRPGRAAVRIGTGGLQLQVALGGGPSDSTTMPEVGVSRYTGPTAREPHAISGDH